jgi:hypothetical protein
MPTVAFALASLACGHVKPQHARQSAALGPDCHKETVFGNDQVPYVGFYRDGQLVRQSNWLPRASFAAMLG